MPTIIEDTRQQKGKHAIKHEWFAAHGIELERRKLDAGDYMRDGSNITVDTKASIAEIAGNISSQHRRFRAECERAAAAGLRLVVLVEQRGYTCIADCNTWVNDHCAACSYRRSRQCNPHSGGGCPRHHTHMKPIQGDRLARAMQTMSDRYGVRFEFCAPKDSARRICELLGVDYGAE